MRLLLILSFLLAGCGGPGGAPIGACETFVKERLRSPSTYERIAADYSSVAFESEGRQVKLVQLEYDAANAYGTPIRSNQNCSFEVDENGKFVDDLEHAARMSAISVSEYAPCCILGGNSKAAESDLMDGAEAAADAAIAAAESAVEEIEEAAE